MDHIKLVSEFASVVVKPNYDANGPRLEVVDLESGRSAYLDPLQISILTRLTAADFEKLFEYSV